MIAQTNEPVAWGVVDARSGVVVSVAECEDDAYDDAEPEDSVVPLYRAPTLTDAERAAIEQMLDEVSGKACAESWVPDIHRNLLERLK